MNQNRAIEPITHEMIEQFWETIPPTWKMVRTHLHVTAQEEFDVTEEQWHVLRHIRKGHHSVSQLAQVKQITPSAISQTVDTLVGKGLVERSGNARDRRYIDLCLTQAGEELVTSIFRDTDSWIEARTAGLSAGQIQSITLGLHLLRQMFSQDEPTA
jgi:DNA-binding MarR family transcriptional regulator